MGIMDVLEELSGPEYDEPEVQTPEPEEETAVPVPEAEPVEEPEVPAEVPAEAPIYIDSPDPEGEPLPEKKRLTLRAEGIMALVAAFAAVLVGVLVVLCMPYFQAEAEKEDPQFLQQRHEAQWATEPVPEPVAVLIGSRPMTLLLESLTTVAEMVGAASMPVVSTIGVFAISICCAPL